MRGSTRIAALAAMAIAGLSGPLGQAAFAGDDARADALQARSDTVSRKAVEKIGSLSRQGERNAIAKAMFGSFSGQSARRYPNGPGWTHAHVQRMARKRSNQKRNKRAHRG